MLTLLMVASLLGDAPALPKAGDQPLHCRITAAADGKAAKCKIKIPSGRSVRACGDADRRASHCDPSGAYVAWTEAQGPGRCRISKKKTHWSRAVVAKLDRSVGGPSSCDLYVELK